MDKVILKLEDAVFVGDYIEQQIENFTADYEIQQTLKEFAKPIQKGLERKLDELQRARAEIEKLRDVASGAIIEQERLYAEVNTLQAENEKLKQVNDEKNELLAQLGCPTIATAKRLSHTLKEQISELKAENARLKENDCEQCKHLDLYIKYKQTLQEIRDMATLFHSVNENKDLDRFKNNILAKINEVIGAE